MADVHPIDLDRVRMMDMNNNSEVIIPRYEFRAFAQSFGKVIDEIRGRSNPELIRESTDTYLVTSGNDINNVKLRYNQLDVKELINVQDGLEQWYPALKLDFPLEARRIGEEIFPALKVQAPDFSRETYTAEQFLQEVIWSHGAVHQARVFKQRFHFDIEGCMVEINELLVNGARIMSVAVEAADAAAVLRVRDMVGLRPYENVNYMLAIKRILGLASLPNPTWT
jgi:exopolyphosphatase/guanosine-5'-triphosphate,3'-diphosphate pyrophosphatase